MTHPSVEDVALHLEGVLDTDDEQRVRTHLEQCTECAATARDLGGVAVRLHAAAHASEPPPIPADVSARVEAALAREAEQAEGDRDRGAVHTIAASAVGDTAGDTATRGSVDDLAERRRRRVLSAGLLAAAAATVVAVGLSELVQSGGVNGASSSAEQVTADRAAGPRPDRLRGPSVSSSLEAGGQAQGPTAGRERRGEKRAVGQDGALAFVQGRGAELALIEGVAAAHSPDRAQHDLPGCVRAALGDDLGPVASYAVRLPGGAGAPAVVVLRPNARPTVGVLVACAPQPHVLTRRGLQP